MADVHTSNDRGSYSFVVFLCCFAGLGGLTFGYGTAVVSGAMLQIKYQYDLSTVWHESIVSVTLGAAAVASACSGVLTDRFGRRPVIILSSGLFTLGSVVLAITRGDGKLMMLSGRLITGLGIGCSTMVVPLYMAEVSPAAIRGTLLTLYALFVTSGILISSIIAGLFSSDETNGWRYMFGIGGIPSVVQLIGFFFLPETPSWLVCHGKLDEAKKALNQIRGSENNETEFSEIQQGALDSNDDDGFMKTLVKMLQSPSVRKALFLGCILQIYQQFCGINTVIYYSGSILRMSGFGSKLAIWLGCIPLAVNVIFTCVGVYAVDKLGRRLLGLISLAGFYLCFVCQRFRDVLPTSWRQVVGIHMDKNCAPLVAAYKENFMRELQKEKKFDDWKGFNGLVVASIILAAGFQLSEINSPLVVSNLNLTYLSCPQMYRKCVDCIKNTNCGFCWTNNGHEITGECLRSDPVRPDSYALSSLNATSKTCDHTQYEDGKEISWGYDFCPSVYSWIAVVGMALFVLAFAPGIGPLSWTINSEIYPLWARGTGISVATAIKWISNLAVSMTFLTLTEYITTYGTFYMYAAISGSGFILFIFILPETKGKSLKEVEDLFTSKHKSSSGSGKINYAFEDTYL